MISEHAIVSPKSSIGKGTHIWHWVQVREGAVIGAECVLAKGVYIDADVQIGDRVKIQNNASLFHGVTIEDGVFIGPHACFTNDKVPRAINADGTLKGAEDWKVSKTLVRKGASIGANATILPGITIGEHAMVGAGSVVTKDVEAYAKVVGNPARKIGVMPREHC
ncbi:MAG: acyltransferase [Nanoarchaeota archaeon]|nr:acyltransferase [Nanoarchaeota archaeon]